MSRVRVVGYVVQPQIMVDDGDNLVPLQVQPLSISAADWPKVLERMETALNELRERVAAANAVEDLLPTPTARKREGS